MKTALLAPSRTLSSPVFFPSSVQDVRATEKDTIEIYKSFRPGDIVQARVVRNSKLSVGLVTSCLPIFTHTLLNTAFTPRPTSDLSGRCALVLSVHGGERARSRFGQECRGRHFGPRQLA